MPKTSLIPVRWILLGLAWTFACAFFARAWAANQVPELSSSPDLTNFSLEELMGLDVTSITKTSTELKDVPAAIYVLTAEDIRHSGATNIPEALRTVPGLHVARIDGNKWAVSIRGFNSQFATKLLVLMDGRSLYTPMFAVLLGIKKRS
jgi:iron complex outermembrane receptor protein